MATPNEDVRNPFTGLDVTWMLQTQAERFKQKPLLTWAPFDAPARHYSYSEFVHLAGCLAASLSAKGVQEGDRVLVHLENCPEFLLSWAALAELGAIAVTTNTRSAIDELSYYIDNSGAKCAITQPSLFSTLQAAGNDLNFIAVTSHNAGVNEVPPSGPGIESFDQMLTGEPAANRHRVSADPNRPVGVQYTSGTTSRPKGVVITHGNALWAARVTGGHLGTRTDDTQLIFLPLFHINALAYSFLPALWKGATVVLMPKFSSSRFWNVSLEHKVTLGSLIPFCYRALADVERPKKHYYRTWGGGISYVPIAQELGIHTVGWYGMTETISQPITGHNDMPNEPDVIGRAAPEYDISIVDENGNPTQYGDVGHLRVKGRPGLSLFKEYLFNEEATRNAFDEEGWFITGDRVIPFENGTIRFSDRDKDMMKVGGENVAPSEVERVLMSLESVAEVAVVAKRHPMLDEVPVAFIRPTQPSSDVDQEALRAEIAAATASALADFKQPREIYFVDDFPRVTLEKIAKAKLRARLEESDK
ncbi:AMP-dependent synthetase and ligase [Hyphomonas adhaerens MHS-3]|uniref:AMP-dependent synthetase and ligase n=1 Tax=Hyphomonas adhaerens MHS-3 TaxID=1280949 RepID=A0A069E9J9_9PROT|nr:AMP-binding protein [Hyphomonas adhaerens]KCZ86011.1 AMP-dependent synthetase and ligase [Hyphomonas adhaerens MHS-3]